MADSAERLLGLIRSMQRIASTSATQGTGWNNIAFGQVIENIANKLGFPSYVEFNERFVDYCAIVRTDVSSMALSKESVRESWKACVSDIQGVFKAQNFTMGTASVFSAHFADKNLHVLEAISERLHTEGVKESSEDQLLEALNAVKDAIDEVCKSGVLNEKLKAILNSYIHQMEYIIGVYSVFGEGNFWRVYKETFATFVQMTPVLVGAENKDRVWDKVRIVASKLAFQSVTGVSLLANGATILQFLTAAHH